MRFRFQVSLASICVAGFMAAIFVHQSRAQVTVDHPAPKLEQSGPNVDPGRHVFMQARCFACHGEYGFGGVGPRFREDRFLGMGDYVVGQILIGRGIMPSFAEALDNKQIAEVASYIRNSWGNRFGPVKPEEVAKVRQEIQLHVPQDRPHLPVETNQPPGLPMPPNSRLPPGQPLPPGPNNR